MTDIYMYNSYHVTLLDIFPLNSRRQDDLKKVSILV